MNQVLTLLDVADEGADDLRRRARELLDRAVQHLEAEDERQKLRVRLERFEEHRNEVLVRELSVTEGQRQADREAIREAASRALAQVGLSATTDLQEAERCLQPFQLSFAHPQEVEQLAARCYQVLLVWAETEAAGGDLASTRQALHLLELAEQLDQAHHLGTPRAFHARRARYLMQAGNEAEARQERQLAEQTVPKTALDLFLTALDGYRQGQPTQAAAACEQVLQKEPDHFWAQYLQALCLLELQRWGEARAGLTACLNRRPDFYWARLLRATAHGQLGEFDQAETDFAQALEQAANDPLACAILWNNRGIMRVHHRQWDQAVDDFQKALVLRPEAEGYVNLAEAYRGRQDWDQAVAALKQAQTLRPNNARLSHLLGQVQLLRGDRDAARQEFEKAIAQEPPGSTSEQLASALVELGRLQHDAHEYPAALALFDRALQVRPDYAPAYGQRAKTRLALKEYTEAAEDLDHYLRQGTPTPDVYQARGLIHAGQHEYPEAVESYSRSLMLKEDANTLSYRGWAFLKMEAARPALADFEAALRLDPDQTDALCGRGHARVRLGQTTAGVHDGEAALRKGQPKASLFLSVACLYGRAAGQPESQPGSGSRTAGEVYRYQERAIELLRAALEHTPEGERKTFWRDHVEHEADLAALRRCNGMLALARAYAP